MVNYRKVTIIRIKRPEGKDLNSELQWLGASLGLFNLRDREKSCYRIFVELLKSSRKGEGRTSDELAYVSGLSRGTIVHHLNKLMDAGLVVNSRNHYLLKGEALNILIKELEKDLQKTLEEMKEIAGEIDEKI